MFQQPTFTIAVGAKTNRTKKSKQIFIAEGYTQGHPQSSDTGNYLVNEQKIVYFWDGKEWHRAVKDLFGELAWHERIKSQPKVKFFKFLKPITVLK